MHHYHHYLQVITYEKDTHVNLTILLRILFKNSFQGINIQLIMRKHIKLEL